MKNLHIISKHILPALLAACALIIALPAVSYAASIITVNVLDTELVVTIPDNYEVLTRDLNSPESQAILDEHNMDRQSFLTLMRNENRYLDAYNTLSGNEIMISCFMDQMSIDTWSFSQKTGEQMASAMKTVEDSVGDAVDVSHYETHGYSYVRYEMEDLKQDAVIYSTVEEGRQIEIAAYAFNGAKLTEDDLASLKEVVDSARIYYDGQEVIDITGGKPSNFDALTLTAVIAVLAAIVIVLVLIFRRHRKRRKR